MPFVFRILVLLYIWSRGDKSCFLLSLLSAIKQNIAEHEFAFQNLLRHTVPERHYTKNCKFTRHGLVFILPLVTVACIFILLLKAGDSEQNPESPTCISVNTVNSSSLALGTSMNLSNLKASYLLFITMYRVLLAK